MKIEINGVELRAERGDVTEQAVDAVVNAANTHLAGGGGVDGAIHRRGGPEIMAECRQIGGCPTGSAVITTAGRLPARFVIHAVAPRWSGGNRGEAQLLTGAYRRSLELADEVGAQTLAFPSLGTGAYCYPIGPASGVAVATVSDYVANASTGLHRVVFVLFSDADLHVYKAAFDTETQRARRDPE